MTEFVVTVSMPEGELEDIMKKLTEAQETIYECYSRLEKLGVLRLEKKDIFVCSARPGCTLEALPANREAKRSNYPVQLRTLYSCFDEQQCTGLAL